MVALPFQTWHAHWIGKVPMDPPQADTRPPFEIGALSLILLFFTGQFAAALAVCIAWIVLNRLWSNASPKVLLVAGIQLGLTTGALLATAKAPVEFVALVEVLGLAVVSLLMVVTGKPIWAYIFLIHSFGFFIFQSGKLFDTSLNMVDQQAVTCVLALRAILAWQLVSYIRQRPRDSGKSQPEPQISENDEPTA
jgi:hypothetical protein